MNYHAPCTHPASGILQHSTPKMESVPSSTLFVQHQQPLTLCQLLMLPLSSSLMCRMLVQLPS